MHKYLCDRCGVEIKPKNTRGILWKSWTKFYSLSYYRTLNTDEESEYMLCPDCSKEFERWMSGGGRHA